ncbi:CRE-RDE-2 protein [Caenorhabditis remanei]|uniref:CRE-RDE-2 protein n=1 Tax=Caenorhabditis remanei TaxID=31234 RepID=E3NE06_CAERE|nr:CRE-RDE-2 protein [Caenorhabditis remanei]
MFRNTKNSENLKILILSQNLATSHYKLHTFLSRLVVQSPEFHGEFILDYTNCVGFEIRDTLPDPMYASAKFYPSRHDPNNGELIITARFSVHANHQTMKFDVHSYDIEFLHIIDDFQMIKGSDQFYDGRSFIVEAQASLGGWLVLRVHEDSNRQFSCDAVSINPGKRRLLYPIIDFNIQFLEDCCPALIPIMTGDGWPHPPQGAPPQQPVFHEEAGSYGQINSSSSTNSHLAPSQIELREITESMSATSISQQAPPTPMAPPTPVAPPPPPQPTVDVTGDSDEEIDDEDSEGTMGTSTIPAKEYMKDVAGKMYQRLIDERPLTGQQPQSALCVVVQQIDKCALLYTAKRDVQNVLLYEKKCEGLPDGRSPELGTIAFFEILPRLMETQDELLPRAPYSHIAVRMKPSSTPESLEKIARFQQKVRCFGGLIEMKVRIPLTQPNNVSIYHPKDEELVNGDDKTFYYLKATNGVIVSIPSERLEPHLDANFQAEFDLIAWVTYRKAIGKVQMHIGRNGEAIRKWQNGRIDELPPLSANNYLMNGTAEKLKKLNFSSKNTQNPSKFVKNRDF